MKKLLLATAALAALATVPARADEPALKLGLGGYVSGYAIYTDQDDTATTDNARQFDFRKDTEVHLTGEVALDNGITAGAHMELLADRADGGSTVEESYMYLSSGWGRINFGEEDGAAYLLQVGAPSADDKIDGIRPDVGTFNVANVGGTLEYAQDDFGYTNKFTYFTPVMEGFQAGFSFTPSVSEGDLDSLDAAVQDDDASDLENGWELAARYERAFDALKLVLGAGFSNAAQEVDNAGDDDLQSWNAGINLGMKDLNLGLAYVTTNNAVDNNGDTDTWVAGIDYTMGVYKLGASYLTQDTEDGAPGMGAQDQNIDRWTVGAIYEWGPGMTFRGSVQFQNADNVAGTAGADRDGTQVAIGTQLNF